MVKKAKGRWRKPDEQAEWLFHRQKRANLLAKPGPLPLTVILDSPKSDFNVGKVFRSAEAFGLASVHLVGIDVFDPAPGQGSFKHVPTRFHETFEDAYECVVALGFKVVALDSNQGEPLPTVDLPTQTALVLGNEDTGLSFDPAQFPEIRWARIPQYGRVESLNVSVAATVAMYEFARRQWSSGADIPVPSEHVGWMNEDDPDS